MSLATMNDLAYDVWEPGLNDQLEHEEGSLYAFLKKSSKDVRGRNVFLKIKKGRSTGIVNPTEGGDYPDAGDPTYAEPKITLARIAGTTEFTLDEMEFLDGTDAAAVAVVKEKMEDLVNTIRRDIVRQSWGDGTGILARVASVSSADITLSAVTDSASASQYDRDRYNWLEEDAMLVGIGDVADGTIHYTGLQIDNINTATNVMTVSSAVTNAAAGDYIFRSGNLFDAGSAVGSREFQGLNSAIATGNTYLNINRATAGNRYWKSNVITGTTAGVLEPISHDRVLSLITKVTRKKGTAPLTSDYCFFSNLGVWNAYGEFLQSGVRYKAMETLDFGWPALQIFGTMFYGDIHASNNRLYLLHKPSLSYRRPKYQRRGTFQFRNEDGSVFRYKNAAVGQGYATAIQAHVTGSTVLVTERPNVHGMLDDVQEVGSGY